MTTNSTETTTNANTTAIARANEDLLSYLKGAEVGMAIVATNLRGAADIDPQLQGVCEVTGTIRGLLGELIEDLVERMDADQAVDDAIAEVDREAKAYSEAEAKMGWDTRKNPGAFSEALAEDSDELASEEAERLKNRAEFEAAEAEKARQVQESLLPPTKGFVLNVLWIGRGDPTKEELDQLVEGNLGAVSAKVDTVPPHYFERDTDSFVEAACKEAANWGHDIVAGDFSADQALQLGIAVAQGEEPYGVRFAIRNDGGGFRIFMV